MIRLSEALLIVALCASGASGAGKPATRPATPPAEGAEERADKAAIPDSVIDGQGQPLVAKGLVAYYPFDVGVRDASGRGNHGQIKGRVRFVPGVVGKAARFGGRDEAGHVFVPNSKSLQFKQDFSIACWVRILDAGLQARPGERRHEDHHVFVAKSSDLAGFFFHAHYGYWSKPPVGLGADNHRPTKTFVLSVTDKLEREWMHVVAVSDVRGLRLYFDGKRVKTAEKPVDFTAANGQSMYVGRQGNASPFPLNGMLDELRIYNRPLSDGEVFLLAQAVPVEVPHIRREPNTDCILLKDGTMLRGTILNPRYTVTTAFGRFTVPAARVVGLAAGAKDKPLRLVLIDGQVRAGTLADAFIELKHPDGSRQRVRAERIRSCGYRISADRPAVPVTPQDASVLLTDDGSRWLGRLGATTLTFRGESKTTTVEVAAVRTIQRTADRPGVLKADVWGNRVVVGRLVEPVVPFTIAAGGEALKLPAGRIVSIVRPSARPPQAMITRIETLVAQLGADAFTEREDATRKLIEMGADIRPLLEKHRSHPDPEIAERIQRILQSPEPDLPAQEQGVDQRTERLMTRS